MTNDFCFEITKEEYNGLLRCQNVTLNKSDNLKGQHLKYLSYVFTEHGVAMLSSVLHSKTAISISVKIINAFVKMKHYLIRLEIL